MLLLITLVFCVLYKVFNLDFVFCIFVIGILYFLGDNLFEGLLKLSIWRAHVHCQVHQLRQVVKITFTVRITFNHFHFQGNF